MNIKLKVSLLSLTLASLALSALGQTTSPTTRPTMTSRPAMVRPTTPPKTERGYSNRSTDKTDVVKQEVKDKITQKRSDLTTRLDNIKDENKKKIVQRVDKAIDDLNAKMTGHFSDILDRLDKALTKIKERSGKWHDKGINVTSIDSAVLNAQNAIQTARVAVTAQAAKTYPIQITTDGKLRGDVGTARQSLHDDLAKVGDLVRAAVKAVKDAIVALAQVAKGNEKTRPSPAISTAPTASPTP